MLFFHQPSPNLSFFAFPYYLTMIFVSQLTNLLSQKRKTHFYCNHQGLFFFFFGCFTWFRSLYFSIYLKILFPSKLSEARQEEMSWINKWIVFWTMSLKAIHEQTSTPVGKVLAYRVFSPDMSHSLSSARTWGKFKSFYKIWGLEGSQMS